MDQDTIATAGPSQEGDRTLAGRAPLDNEAGIRSTRFARQATEVLHLHTRSLVGRPVRSLGV